MQQIQYDIIMITIEWFKCDFFKNNLNKNLNDEVNLDLNGKNTTAHKINENYNDDFI